MERPLAQSSSTRYIPSGFARCFDTRPLSYKRRRRRRRACSRRYGPRSKIAPRDAILPTGCSWGRSTNTGRCDTVVCETGIRRNGGRGTAISLAAGEFSPVDHDCAALPHIPHRTRRPLLPWCSAIARVRPARLDIAIASRMISSSRLCSGPCRTLVRCHELLWTGN